MTRFGVLWPLEAADPAVHAQSIRNTGCKEVRLQLLWDRVERAEGIYDWSFYDPLIKTIRDAGLGVLPMVYHTPPWHRPKITDAPDPEIYARFAVAIARHYNFQNGIEIINEPNWRYSKDEPLDFDGTGEQYSAIYRTARAWLHAAGYTAILGGLAWPNGWSGEVHGDARDWLGWNWDRLGPIDGIGIHPYSFGPDPLGETMEKLQLLSAFLTARGWDGKLDITEINLAPGHTEKQRATYLKGLATKLKPWKRVRRCDVFLWWGSGENEQWSIATSNGAWKGSASAYAAAIKA